MERTMSEQAALQTQTETISEADVTDSGSQDVPTVRLRLRKPKSNKKVQWTQGTVDNENLNKKKSKCCCIYEKSKTFGESSSEDSDDECEHCHGHKDAHKKVLPKPGDPAREGMSSHPEPIATGST
ncbi:PREDICTED: protein phosphatase 1 regulatory subunit 11 [Wasmannia auropunctata]|uniref:protein phosphatase 1 regulatory subunit 11 n=1 Tax=Wasmannia auropunctata TaxID=64793 RepID=UPI0005EE7710|nr:PREDICTED: protein phosphatase 1 regulatory subunit 11 [Wasmannia auropunctata]